MRFEYIEPFVSATVRVLETVLQAGVGHGEVALVGGHELGGDITVVIPLKDRSGDCVILNMDRVTADGLTAALNGPGGAAAEGVREDTIGELANMIAGNALSALNAENNDITIYPPETVSREELYRQTEGRELLQVPVTSPQGFITVNFTIRTE